MASKRKDIHRPKTIIVVKRGASLRTVAADKKAGTPNAALKALFSFGNSLLANR